MKITSTYIGKRSEPSVEGRNIDRSEVSRALAKAIAYANCGKVREAEVWAARLVRQLQCANILRSETP